jgi:hypothetical protein
MHGFLDVLDIALSRFGQQRARTMAAVLAIAVAVLGIVLIAGNMARSRRAARELAFAMFDLSTLTVTAPREGESPEHTRPLRRTLEAADAAALRGVPDVLAVLPYQQGAVAAKSGREVTDMVMFGGPVRLADALGCKLLGGRQIADVGRRARLYHL